MLVCTLLPHHHSIPLEQAPMEPHFTGESLFSTGGSTQKYQCQSRASGRASFVFVYETTHESRFLWHSELPNVVPRLVTVTLPQSERSAGTTRLICLQYSVCEISLLSSQGFNTWQINIWKSMSRRPMSRIYFTCYHVGGVLFTWKVGSCFTVWSSSYDYATRHIKVET